MVELDKRNLEQLIKNKKRSEFIQKAQFKLLIYKFEPDDFLEIVGENEVSKRTEYLQKLAEEAKKNDPNYQAEKLKNNQALEGNLAMKFLLKSGDLNSLMSFSGTNKDKRQRKDSDTVKSSISIDTP